MTFLLACAAWLISACLLAAVLAAVFRGARKGEAQAEMRYGAVVPLPRVGDQQPAVPPSRIGDPASAVPSPRVGDRERTEIR